MSGIDNLTKEEAQQIVSFAGKIYKILNGAVPKFSQFAVIMGIMDFLERETNNNKEKEVSHFITAKEALNEALNEMGKRF